MDVDGAALSVAKALFRTWCVDLISAARFLLEFQSRSDDFMTDQ